MDDSQVVLCNDLSDESKDKILSEVASWSVVDISERPIFHELAYFSDLRSAGCFLANIDALIDHLGDSKMFLVIMKEF